MVILYFEEGLSIWYLEGDVSENEVFAVSFLQEGVLVAAPHVVYEDLKREVLEEKPEEHIVANSRDCLHPAMRTKGSDDSVGFFIVTTDVNVLCGIFHPVMHPGGTADQVHGGSGMNFLANVLEVSHKFCYVVYHLKSCLCSSGGTYSFWCFLRFTFPLTLKR